MKDAIFWAVWIILGVIMLVFYGKTKRPVKNAAIGMTLGGVGLLGVHFLGGYFGLTLSLNLFNTMVSLILGIPGVVLLTVGNVLM